MVSKTNAPYMRTAHVYTATMAAHDCKRRLRRGGRLRRGAFRRCNRGQSAIMITLKPLGCALIVCSSFPQEGLVSRKMRTVLTTRTRLGSDVIIPCVRSFSQEGEDNMATITTRLLQK